MSKFKAYSILHRIARLWLVVWIISALGAGMLATHVPWVAKQNGEIFYPAFRLADVLLLNQELPAEWQDPATLPPGIEIIIAAPVPYNPHQLDLYGRNDFEKHLLGTDELGRDVFSRILHGARTALLTGIIAMAFALALGLSLGGIAGYFGDHRIQLSRGQILLLIPGMLLAWFYGWQIPVQEADMRYETGFEFESIWFQILILAGVPVLCLRIGRRIMYPKMMQKKHHVWADFLVSRGIEIKQSIPGLFLIIAVAALLEPTPVMIALLIGFTAWTPIARFVRAELLKIREENYIQAAEALGYSGLRIFVRHALPNALSPVWVLASFGFAGAILAEASVSFIREQGDAVSWGGMLAAARHYPEAWWMAVWPGLALFFTLISLHITGEQLRDTFTDLQ